MTVDRNNKIARPAESDRDSPIGANYLPRISRVRDVEPPAWKDARRRTSSPGVPKHHLDAAQRSAAVRDAPARLSRHISEDVILGALRGADAIAIGVCGLFSLQVFDIPKLQMNTRPSQTLALSAIPLAAALLQRAATYRTASRTTSVSGLGEAFAYLALVASPLLLLTLAPRSLGSGTALWALLWLLFCACAFALIRVAARPIVTHWVKSGRQCRRTAIFGASPTGSEMARRILSGGSPHLALVSVFDDRRDRVPREIEGLPVLGGLDELVASAGANDGGVDEVIIALPWSAKGRVQQICDRLDSFPIDVHLAGEANLSALNRKGRLAARLPIVPLVERPLSAWECCQKTAMDYAAALLVLTLIGPLMLCVAIAIRLDSAGPIFFRQPREGWGGRVFQVLKFRTMYAHLSDPACQSQSSEIGHPRDENWAIPSPHTHRRATTIHQCPQGRNVRRRATAACRRDAHEWPNKSAVVEQIQLPTEDQARADWMGADRRPDRAH